MIRVFKLALLTTLIIISGFASAEIDAGLLELAEQGYAKAQNNLGVAMARVWANLAGANG